MFCAFWCLWQRGLLHVSTHVLVPQQPLTAENWCEHFVHTGSNCKWNWHWLEIGCTCLIISSWCLWNQLNDGYLPRWRRTAVFTVVVVDVAKDGSKTRAQLCSWFAIDEGVDFEFVCQSATTILSGVILLQLKVCSGGGRGSHSMWTKLQDPALYTSPKYLSLLF